MSPLSTISRLLDQDRENLDGGYEGKPLRYFLVKSCELNWDTLDKPYETLRDYSYTTTAVYRLELDLSSNRHTTINLRPNSKRGIHLRNMATTDELLILQHETVISPTSVVLNIFKDLRHHSLFQIIGP